MNRIFLLLTFLLLILPPLAPAHTTYPNPVYDEDYLKIYFTKPRYVAATTEELLDKAIYVLMHKGNTAFRNFMIEQPEVFYLRAGLACRITKKSVS